MNEVEVPEELRERNPLITSAGLKMLRRLSEHEDAPRWNHTAGDRVTQEDLTAVNEFRQDLKTKQKSSQPKPPDSILSWLESRKKLVPLFREHLTLIMDVEKQWAEIPTMSREDIAIRPQTLVPDDADLERLIVYRTAGTTGHALLVPHASRAAAMYHPLQEQALERYGINLELNSDTVSCFLVCAQARTVTYPTVLSVWNQTGFAKVNISPKEWPQPHSAGRYFNDMQPRLLTGDPISFAEMMRQEIEARPQAMISTAVAMSSALKKKLELHYSCPVIDWYSLTETGPIGYFCTHGTGYHILPHDLYVEALGPDGRPVTDGESGEITVTGGRNPFLPLLRYRTGDWGKLNFGVCSCGDPSPRLIELQGRQPVLFRNNQGDPINAVDLSNILRDFPLVQHEFKQRKDESCIVTVRPISGSSPDLDRMKQVILQLFGANTKLEINVDDELGNRTTSGKVLTYQSELTLED